MRVNNSKKVLLLFVCALAYNAATALELVTTNIIDLGQIYNYDTSEQSYIVANKGGNDIRILDMISTCSCIAGIKDKDIIKAGEEYTLKTQFNPRAVYGRFSRGVWLETSDRSTPRIQFKVIGEVLPLFTGLPTETIHFHSENENTTFTNKFTITGVTTNYTIGVPVSSASNVKIQTTIEKDKKNLTPHTLRLSLNPPAGMRMRSSLNIPVIGPKEIGDLRIQYSFAAGVQLKASPSRIIVTNPEQSLSRRLYLSTYSGSNTEKDITFEPQVDGINIEVKEFARRPPQNSTFIHRTQPSNLASKNKRYSCTVTVTPEALKTLLVMDKPGITFSCPGHKPVTVTFENMTK